MYNKIFLGLALSLFIPLVSSDELNSGDTSWILTSTALVLLLIRTKEAKLCNISMVDLEAHDTVFCFLSVVTLQSLYNAENVTPGSGRVKSHFHWETESNHLISNINHISISFLPLETNLTTVYVYVYDFSAPILNAEEMWK